jgi:hypothetical protein
MIMGNIMRSSRAASALPLKACFRGIRTKRLVVRFTSRTKPAKPFPATAFTPFFFSDYTIFAMCLQQQNRESYTVPVEIFIDKSSVFH